MLFPLTAGPSDCNLMRDSDGKRKSCKGMIDD